MLKKPQPREVGTSLVPLPSYVPTPSSLSPQICDQLPQIFRMQEEPVTVAHFKPLRWGCDGAEAGGPLSSGSALRGKTLSEKVTSGVKVQEGLVV